MPATKKSSHNKAPALQSRYSRKGILLFVLAFALVGCYLLLRSFAAAPSLYYGVHVPGWLNNLSALNTFEADAGKKASIVMLYQGWGLTDGSQNFEPAWMNNIRNHGSIPMVTWEPWLYTNGVRQPQYSLNNIINGRFDNYITKFALASKSWSHPYFLRFAHEMNGNWYPWSETVNGNSAGQYVRAWRHVHDIFARNGANNVTWVWSPNVEYNGSISLKELYPGDGYVDWLGLDGYNWGTVGGHSWQSFGSIFGRSYNDITAISARPLLVAETASTEHGGNKAQWIASSLGSDIFKYPRVRGFIWFNENKETDWRIESSTGAKAAFRQAVGSSSYKANSFANLSTKPL